MPYYYYWRRRVSRCLSALSVHNSSTDVDLELTARAGQLSLGAHFFSLFQFEEYQSDNRRYVTTMWSRDDIFQADLLCHACLFDDKVESVYRSILYSYM